MDDNFDFDQYMENSENEFNSKLEEWQERLMKEAIETNYKKISENGIADWHLRNMDDDDLANLHNTLQIMLDYFEESEEYEKCKVVYDSMIKVQDLLVA